MRNMKIGFPPWTQHAAYPGRNSDPHERPTRFRYKGIYYAHRNLVPSLLQLLPRVLATPTTGSRAKLGANCLTAGVPHGWIDAPPLYGNEPIQPRVGSLDGNVPVIVGDRFPTVSSDGMSCAARYLRSGGTAGAYAVTRFPSRRLQPGPKACGLQDGGRRAVPPAPLKGCGRAWAC